MYGILVDVRVGLEARFCYHTGLKNAATVEFGGMMAPRLIACDVDGTLLPAGQVELSGKTVELIRRVIEAGITFVPASGRQLTGLKKVFAPVGCVDAFVAEDGAVSCVASELVDAVPIDRDLGDELVRAVLAKPECELYVGGVETCYVQSDNAAFIDHLRTVLNFDVTIVDDATAVPEPYWKISAYHAANDPDFDYWAGNFSNRCKVVLAGCDWIDMIAPGVSKAAGVAAVCRALGVDPADCVAFGDADNDVEMFELVGRSYAMESASEAAREAADETTASVEEILERILAEIG